MAVPALDRDQYAEVKEMDKYARASQTTNSEGRQVATVEK